MALKVLPEAFTADPDRLARFEREAKVLASLNHPNIGHIYGLEESEGVKALEAAYLAHNQPVLPTEDREPVVAVETCSVVSKELWALGCASTESRPRVSPSSA